jgi:hypothetical protein
MEVFTPAGSARWFEEVTQLADDDADRFRDACERYGIRFLTDSPWTDVILERFRL